MPKYGPNGEKKIPASKIIESFRNLPEKKRAEILRANLSEITLYQIGELEFATSLGQIKNKDSETIKAYLTDDKNFGGPWKDLIPLGEDIAGAHLSSIYSRFRVPSGPGHEAEKLTRAEQICMIENETYLDPESLARDLNDDNWDKKIDPHKAIAEQEDVINVPYNKVKRIKAAVEDIPETDEDKAIFTNAALQTCKDIKRRIPANERDTEEFRELEKYRSELCCDIVKREVKTASVQELRERLDGEYRTLEKEKSGWFLSKTNTREHDDMTKGVRLFYAKLDMLNGKEPKGLTDDELKTVNDTDVEKLFNNAKRGCYNYGCLKTSNGTDSIIHAAGNKRFDSSMKTLSGLNELGVKLHLCEPAAALRDEAQREMLQHRRDKNWLAQNVENLAAKTIYAQTLLNKGVSEAEQKRLLEDASLNAEVEKIKADKSFKEACCLLLPEFDRVVIKLFDRHSRAKVLRFRPPGWKQPFRECAEGIKHADSEKCRKGDDGDAALELELLFQTIYV